MNNTQTRQTRQSPTRQVGNLSYSNVQPQFVGQPVEDLKASRKALQAASDVNEQRVLELQAKYGEIVNDINNKELGYIAKFDDDFTADTEDMIAKGNFQLLGPTISKHAGKLVSDKGLQKRFQRQENYAATKDAIANSNYSYEEKLVMDSMEDFQYTPVTAEEDANGIYKEPINRQPPVQSDIALKLNTYFKNITPDSISRGFTHFIKPNADGNDGYQASELTTSFDESDKTGIVYNKTTSHTYKGKDKIKTFFRGLANENVDPEIANFLKFKYELANRNVGESNGEYNKRVGSTGTVNYENFLNEAFDELAEGLAFSQNSEADTLRHISSLSDMAKRNAEGKTRETITTYDRGRTTTSPLGSSPKEAATVIQDTKLATDATVKLYQENIGIPIESQKSYEELTTAINNGIGIKGAIPELTNDHVKSNAIASAYIDQSNNESIADTRHINAIQYAISSLKDTYDLSDAELARIQGIGDDLKTTTDPNANLKTAAKNIKQIGITQTAVRAGVFAGELAQQIGTYLGDATGRKFKNKVKEYYDNNSEVTIDSQITTAIPQFGSTDTKLFNKDMLAQINRKGFYENANILTYNDDPDGIEDFIKVGLSGTVVDTELVGYRPVPIDGQRHWVINTTIKDADGNLKKSEILVPFNKLRSKASDLLMSLPETKASDMLMTPMLNNLTSWSPYEGVEIRYNKGVGNTLIINGEIITEPNDNDTTGELGMISRLSEYIVADRNRIINGDTK